VSIGRYVFDRKIGGHFRVGYEVTKGSGSTGGTQRFSTIRVTNGPWGEDLPFSIVQHRAVEQLDFANFMISRVGKSADTPTPEEGFRNQKF
jgi:hypothetical protein